MPILLNILPLFPLSIYAAGLQLTQRYVFERYLHKINSIQCDPYHGSMLWTYVKKKYTFQSFNSNLNWYKNRTLITDKKLPQFHTFYYIYFAYYSSNVQNKKTVRKEILSSSTFVLIKIFISVTVLSKFNKIQISPI